ncbi:PAS domain S-box protein [Kovacikia minuta CCNUW1]|uniref:PAS domain S-box protein n=1 Tax=Kovacikia minuta TaxID=2931930 RepID=UPI001CCC193F|nr:PAS domain S-box protein [Kovacikia minuta]UBF25711.1 PAS domain S-box protein [Kovacikia minuta CCNUW1]
MVSKTITFRFPEEVIEAIEARAKATGSNRTAVLMQALAQAYGLPSPTAAPISTTTLQQQFQTLEQQVVTVLEQISESVSTLKQNAVIAAQAGALQHRHILIEEPTERGELARSPQEFPLIAHFEHKAKMLDQILSATPDLVLVQDRLGRFAYVNFAGARALGFEQSYFLGKTCSELGTTPDIEDLFSAKCETVFTTGRPVNGEISIPALYETRDYEYILSPIYSGDSSIEAVVCTARDITERKLAEVALRKSEEEYRNLFELANDSIFIIDASTNRILNANRNAARRLGYTRRELLQLSFADVEAQRIDQETLNSELQKIGSVVYEHKLRRKDGTEIPVEISSRLIESGEQLALQSFVRDLVRPQESD